MELRSRSNVFRKSEFDCSKTVVWEVQEEPSEAIFEARGPRERLCVTCDGRESQQVRLKTAPGVLQRLREAPASSPGTILAFFLELSKVILDACLSSEAES